MVTDQNKYACRIYLASQTNFNKRKRCSKGHKFNCQHLKIGDFTWITQTYRSLSGDKVELSSDVHLTQGMSSPVPLPFSLVSMGLRSSQWLFIKVLCAALLFLDRTRKNPSNWENRWDKWKEIFPCLIFKQNMSKKVIIPL